MKRTKYSQPCPASFHNMLWNCQRIHTVKKWDQMVLFYYHLHECPILQPVLWYDIGSCIQASLNIYKAFILPGSKFKSWNLTTLWLASQSGFRSWRNDLGLELTLREVHNAGWSHGAVTHPMQIRKQHEAEKRTIAMCWLFHACWFCSLVNVVQFMS